MRLICVPQEYGSDWEVFSFNIRSADICPNTVLALFTLIKIHNKITVTIIKITIDIEQLKHYNLYKVWLLFTKYAKQNIFKLLEKCHIYICVHLPSIIIINMLCLKLQYLRVFLLYPRRFLSHFGRRAIHCHTYKHSSNSGWKHKNSWWQRLWQLAPGHMSIHDKLYVEHHPSSQIHLSTSLAKKKWQRKSTKILTNSTKDLNLN